MIILTAQKTNDTDKLLLFWNLKFPRWNTVYCHNKFRYYMSHDREQMALQGRAPSDGSDLPSCLVNHVKVFLLPSMNSQRLADASYGPQMLWSDCVDAEADLNLSLPHMLEDTLSHGMTHMYVCNSMVYHLMLCKVHAPVDKESESGMVTWICPSLTVPDK